MAGGLDTAASGGGWGVIEQRPTFQPGRGARASTAVKLCSRERETARREDSAVTSVIETSREIWSLLKGGPNEVFLLRRIGDKVLREVFRLRFDLDG